MGTHLPIELTLDSFLNWLLENTQNATITDILEAVNEAGQRAVDMVNVDPHAGPYFDELLFDKVYYHIINKLGVYIEKHIDELTGTITFHASRTENGMPRYYGDTEAQAVANWLRNEHPPV